MRWVGEKSMSVFEQVGKRFKELANGKNDEIQEYFTQALSELDENQRAAYELECELAEQILREEGPEGIRRLEQAFVDAGLEPPE
jgi:hypothetical protein